MKKNAGSFVLSGVVLFLLVLACGRAGDGPMNLNSEEGVSGEGFYLSALFDSGRVYVAEGGVLLLQLDSLFLLSDCSLDSLVLTPAVDLNLSEGVRRQFFVKVWQSASQSVNCAASGLENDTLVKISLTGSWQNVREAVVLGWHQDSSGAIQVDADSLKKDSILVRRGKRQDSVFVFARDTLFEPQENNINPHILRRVRDTLVQRRILLRHELRCLDQKLYPDCKELLDSSEFLGGRFQDTLFRFLNYLCPNIDSLFCEVEDRDTSLVDAGQAYMDSTFFWHDLFVEELSACSRFNLFSIVDYRAKDSSSIRLRRELFILDPSEGCEKEEKSFLVYELEKDTLVTDSTQLREFLGLP